MLTLQAPTLTIATPDLLAPRAAKGDPTDAELARLPHLRESHHVKVKAMQRRFEDARRNNDATAAIGRLPRPGEALHLAVDGRFALWNCVPAVLDLSRSAIDSLHVATLGFSRDNVTAMLGLMDIGDVKRLVLLCSHYFRNTSGGIFEYAQRELAKRPQAVFISARQHAKLLCVKLANGQAITVESSANLRSCKNIETMTFINDSKVYAFHTQWIESLAEKQHEAN